LLQSGANVDNISAPGHLQLTEETVIYILVAPRTFLLYVIEGLAGYLGGEDDAGDRSGLVLSLDI
jgi:hypothetical protein